MDSLGVLPSRLVSPLDEALGGHLQFFVFLASFVGKNGSPTKGTKDTKGGAAAVNDLRNFHERSDALFFFTPSVPSWLVSVSVRLVRG